MVHRSPRMNKLAFSLAAMLMVAALSVVSGVVVAEPHEVGASAEPIAKPVACAAVESVDGKIFVIGGYGVGLTSVDTVQIYDVSTGTVTYGAKMIRGVGVAAHALLANGTICVIGGYNQSVGATSGVQFYNPTTDKWSVGPNLAPVALTIVSGVAGADGRIYVFGGYYMPNMTLIYDPTDHEWSFGADNPVPVWAPSLVSVSATEIYVIGGGGTDAGIPVDAVRVYNPVSDSWTTVSPMVRPTSWGAATYARNGHIYVFGGDDDISINLGSDYAEIQRYDPVDDEWADLPSSLITPRRAADVVLDEFGRAFIVGGYSASAVSVLDSVEMWLLSDISGLGDIVIATPQDGSIVSGVVSVQVSVANSGPSYLGADLFVDGLLVESQVYGEGWVFTWDTTGLPAGSTHTLMARAYATNGSVVEDSVTVTVTDQSAEEALAVMQQQLADLQMQLYYLALAMAEANESTMAYLEEQIAILQAALTQIGEGLAQMGAGQTAAMADLNETLVDLQAQLDAFQEQIDRIENKADTAGTYGIVTMALVIVIVVLVALMVVMARKKP
ncbi:MAG: hypothetical protein JW880_03300 [Candidatus Thermoplasmatota archaeon]|nr:hypothetical protein [Candidatus Thermoplasmatota archaeon]